MPISLNQQKRTRNRSHNINLNMVLAPFSHPKEPNTSRNLGKNIVLHMVLGQACATSGFIWLPSTQPQT